MKRKIILHLCSKHGSDSRYYDLDPNYQVIKIGIDIGVENFSPSPSIKVHGVIGNPVCDKFSMVGGVIRTKEELDEGMFLVNECMRIIDECKALGGLKWWVIENPAAGMLHTRIGKPKHKYQPWQFGAPFTKNTALWGDFNMPDKLFEKWEDVPKNPNLYIRPGRSKPSLAIMHKNDIRHFPEWSWCSDDIHNDSDLRSLCSDNFAKALYKANP